MKREDLELDLENFNIEDIEEEEFMLNDNKSEVKNDIFDMALDLFKEDNIIDTKEEKDFAEGIEQNEVIDIIEDKPSIDANIEIISEDSIIDLMPIQKQKLDIKQDEIINEPELIREEKKEEVIVIEEPIIEEEKKEEQEKEPIEKKDSNNEENKKKKIMQIVFCTISAIFILGCIGFYLPRLIKYYKIYNPKSESGEKVVLLSQTLTEAESIVTEGDGLYKSGAGYAYKGVNVNNYVKINNQIFRVLKTNQDGSADLILDTPLNTMMWNNEYIEYKNSDINKYLNEEFIKTLDKELLSTITICEDKVEGLNDIKCDTQDNSSYVRILGITEYLNATIDNKSFIGSNYELWLYNQTSEKVWYTSGNNIAETKPNDFYYVRPVIRLKNSTAVLSGKGTKEKPYLVTKENKAAKVGDYVKLGEDIWSVVRNEDKLTYLAKVNNISTTFRFDLKENMYNPESTSSIASYLNNSFYNSLEYKELIKEGTYYTGKYLTSYKEVFESKLKANVGMLSILDSKYNIGDQSYYLLNGAEDLYVNFFDAGNIVKSKITLAKGIKPVIAIDSSILVNGDGSQENPLTIKE